MRITKIIVTKLFGIFDHEIPLNLDDRITVIHAPNGFGKTIILRMLDGLFNGSYSVFFSVPFEKFTVEFDDNINIWIEKKEYNELDDHEMSKESKSIPSKIIISMSEKGNNEPKSFPYSYKEIGNIEDLKKVIDTKTSIFERIGSEEWLYTSTGETLSIYDIVDRFLSSLPEWWINFQKSTEIQFIQTQRLQNFGMDFDSSVPIYRRIMTVISMVEKYANDLKEEIKQELAESASLSQSLDRTFPERLIQQMQKKSNSELTIDKINLKLRELEEKRSKLMDVGLLDEEADSGFRIPETTDQDTKEILTVYIEDMEKKLGIFDDLAEKIDLFKEMINKRFLYKEMLISKDKGFYFITPDGKTLPLYALSSGEQHELVLLYQLLFKTKPNTVILIDEPEISLHVAWQVEFLKDLQEIVNLAEIDVILATHSPQIINDRWDLTVELEAPVAYEAVSHNG